MERANIADGALERLIGEYTREAGVRQLEREIQGVLRKAALEVVEGRTAAIKITAKNLEKFRGTAQGPERGGGAGGRGGRGDRARMDARWR